MKMKHRFQKAVALATMALIFAPAAFAQSTSTSGGGLGGILKRLTGVSNDAIWFMQVFAIVLGIGLIIGGILALVKDAKAQGNGPVSKGAAAIMLICGGVLAFVGSLIDTTGDTIWGDNQGSRSRITIPQ